MVKVKAVNIAKNLVKTVEEKLKLLSKLSGKKYISVAAIDEKLASDFLKSKQELDKARRDIKALELKYDFCRDEVLSKLPGKDEDTIDIIVNGVRIHKYPRNMTAGKYDSNKIIELLKGKRLLNKIAPQTRTIDKNALMVAIGEEKITHEEYLACTIRSVTSVLEVTEVESEIVIEQELKEA